ncbi:MAG: hypothetical protein JWN63_235 [Candidatus Acidoferrum typicum]|nr:hypothetical protein [Candidatus Acidoferrum typicum]
MSGRSFPIYQMVNRRIPRKRYPLNSTSRNKARIPRDFDWTEGELAIGALCFQVMTPLMRPTVCSDGWASGQSAAAARVRITVGSVQTGRYSCCSSAAGLTPMQWAEHW